MNCIHNKDEQEHCEECNCDKPQHTATPWEFNGLEIQAKNKHETLIAEVYEENEFSKANAQFIVKAVNNHDALMEALKMAHNSLRTFRDVPQEDQLWLYSDDETMLAIETALAKVEKG